MMLTILKTYNMQDECINIDVMSLNKINFSFCVLKFKLTVLFSY